MTVVHEPEASKGVSDIQVGRLAIEQFFRLVGIAGTTRINGADLGSRKSVRHAIVEPFSRYGPARDGSDF